jgi:hypothetical protein
MRTRFRLRHALRGVVVTFGKSRVALGKAERRGGRAFGGLLTLCLFLTRSSNGVRRDHPQRKHVQVILP